MSKKRRKSENTVETIENDNTQPVVLSKEDYLYLKSLANERAQQTIDDEDDQRLVDIDSSIDELGETIQNNDNSRWELDENPIIRSIQRALRREELLANGKWYRPSTVKPLVNTIGEFDIITILRSFLTKNIALGNISKDAAHSMTAEIVEAVINVLELKWKEWGLDKAYHDYIVELVDKQVYVHLTRPVDEGERKYRGGRFHTDVAQEEMYDSYGQQRHPHSEEQNQPDQMVKM